MLFLPARIKDGANSMTQNQRVTSLKLPKQYHRLGFSLNPLVKWERYKLDNKDVLNFLTGGANWAIRCDENFHALDFDDGET